jgi:hypothetical protein
MMASSDELTIAASRSEESIGSRRVLPVTRDDCSTASPLSVVKLIRLSQPDLVAIGSHCSTCYRAPMGQIVRGLLAADNLR